MQLFTYTNHTVNSIDICMYLNVAFFFFFLLSPQNSVSKDSPSDWKPSLDKSDQ